jgi:hypothetical protein
VPTSCGHDVAKGRGFAVLRPRETERDEVRLRPDSSCQIPNATLRRRTPRLFSATRSGKSTDVNSSSGTTTSVPQASGGNEPDTDRRGWDQGDLIGFPPIRVAKWFRHDSPL